MNISPNDGYGDGEIIRVPDSTGSLKEFNGILLADVSTENPDSLRWMEMELYKVTDGTNRYVLHLVARSVVYHRFESDCKRGVPRPVSDKDWPEDAEPCRTCRPSLWLDAPDDRQYDLEIDRHTTFVCEDAAEMISHLRVGPQSRGKLPPGALSGPAQRLLDIAAHRDDNIAAATRSVERI